MFLVIALCLIAGVTAAPAPQSLNPNEIYTPGTRNANVLKNYNENLGTGNYRFGFLLSDGTVREEEGQLINAGQENAYIFVKGMYAFNAPNNRRYPVRYQSGVRGYEPKEVKVLFQPYVGVLATTMMIG